MNISGADEGSTRSVYNKEYFEGNRSKSNYSGYAEASYGPSRILAECLYKFFRPLNAFNGGCAVGHDVKRMAELGIDAHGVDISDWAVEYADTPRVGQGDFSTSLIPGQYDLVYSYDVVEHIVPERLGFAVSNLWQATKRDLLIVPATYENGETFDPDEPTHLTFQPYAWWVKFIVAQTGARFDEEATKRFAEEEHSKTFAYSHRAMIFTRIGA
ncbi:class I SAM-dependent methyltransferase [Sphingomonas immobilis]|uniref:Class I SAM-dependent methyltransferase n=1 Tax=Sphingomonas immobilis TaxID=3063997 RepID=A0ABT9A402_9SPHN|nr:class I SAM-dependent methyltransferase [Sphingomonas sp. CA1-15]MDO7843696.1 class I SAM-dependent methyltransferase [Sphingomonas sp. CA1-15]